MQTVNYRLLIILVAAALGVGAVVYVVHGFQVKRNAGVFLREARAAAAEGEEAVKNNDRQKASEALRRASQNYNSYLQIRRDDVEAMEDYAEFLVRHGNLQDAVGIYEDIVLLAPNRHDIRRKVVDTALDVAQIAAIVQQDSIERARLTSRMYGKAREHLNVLLQAKPNDAQLLDCLARCDAGTGNERGAAESFRKAIAADPKQLDSYARLALLLQGPLKRPDEAEAAIQSMLESNATSANAQVIAGSYYQAAGKPELALKHAQEALQLEIENRRALLVALFSSTALAAQPELSDDERKAIGDRGKQYAAEGIARYPDDVQFFLGASELETRLGNIDGALQHLRDGLHRNPGQPQLAVALARSLVDAGQLDEAESQIEPLSKVVRPDIAGQVESVRGRIAMGRSQWKVAIAAFERARVALVGSSQYLPQINYWLGRCYRELRNTDQEILAYRRALEVNPRFTQAQLALIEALANQQRYNEAIAESQKAAIRSPATVWLVARLLFLRALRSDPAQRDWRLVERAIDEATKLAPNAPDALLLRVQLLTAQGRHEEAERLLATVSENEPDRLDALLARVALADREESPERAEQLLSEAQERFGDTIELRLARARHALLRNRAEALPELEKLAEAPAEFTDAQRVELWNGLVPLASQLTDVALAAKLAGQVADREPANLGIRFTLFELALRAQDRAQMEKLVEEIRRIEGDGALYHYTNAVLLALQAESPKDKRLDEALASVARARELNANWSRIAVLAGSIYEQRGDPDRALAEYQTAIALGDRNPQAIRRLTQLLYQKRRYAEAQKTLELLGTQPGEDAELEGLRGRLALHLGDFEQSLQLAREAAAESKEAADHLWLAQLLDAFGRRANLEGNREEARKSLEEAEAAYRKAVELAPDDPELRVALVRFFSSNGETEKAEAAIKELTEHLDPEEAPLVLAQAYQAIDRKEEARKQYEQALAQKPDDLPTLRAAAEFYWRNGEREAAEKLGRRVLDGQVKATPDDVNWSRRLLAMLLSAGDAADRRKALELMEQNLATPQAITLDRRIRIGLWRAMPSRVDQLKAAQALDELIAKGESVTADDRFALAQLYLSLGDWSRFTVHIQRLLGEFPNEPNYLAYYVNALLGRDDVQSAELYLAQLEKLAPNAYATISLRAEILFRRGDYQAVLELLKSFIDREGAVPTQRDLRMRQVAERLQHFHSRMTAGAALGIAPIYARDADMIFQQYVDQNPTLGILRVSFLARLGRISDALDLLERVWATYTPEGVANAVAEVFRAPQATSDERQRVEQIARDAAAHWQRPEPLLIVLAEMASEQGRADEAERIYREVLARSPNAIAMNNLAVLLALNEKQLDEALQLINRAIDKAGRVPSMLDSRASVYLALGQPQKALADLDEALADAEDPVRLFHQAQAYQKAGRQREARQSLEKALAKGLAPELLQSLERPKLEQLKKLVE
ncbi:MAG: tetratricopeptide repeat protein [Planctomycetota bacterium]